MAIPSTLYRQKRLRVRSAVSRWWRCRYCREMRGPSYPVRVSRTVGKCRSRDSPRNFLAAAWVRRLVCSAWAICPRSLSIRSGRALAQQDVDPSEIRAPSKTMLGLGGWSFLSDVGKPINPASCLKAPKPLVDVADGSSQYTSSKQAPTVKVRR